MNRKQRAAVWDLEKMQEKRQDSVSNHLALDWGGSRERQHGELWIKDLPWGERRARGKETKKTKKEERTEVRVANGPWNKEMEAWDVSKLNFHFTSSVKVSLGSSSSPSWLLCVSAELCANARWLHYTVSHALHDGYKLPKIRGCFPYPWDWWPWIRSLTSMRLFSLSATPQVGDGDLLK